MHFSEAHSNDIAGVPYAFFHAPGDHELNFEGGLQKIALRSTFTPGTVTVTATAPGTCEQQRSADLGHASGSSAIAAAGDHRAAG